MSKGQLLEKSVELTLYMCMPGGISRYLGGMVGIQEAATVSQVVDSITTALQAEYAHAVELAGTNMTMRQICAPFSNSIYQNLKTVETVTDIAKKQGREAAQRAFETVENNPGLVANNGSSVAEAMQKVANTEVGPIGAAEKASLTGRCLSKNDIQHFSKHIPAEFAQQAKNMPTNILEARLTDQSFFNPSWSKEDIIKYVNEAYTKLREQGATGLNEYVIHGEKIMVHIKPNGKISTAYGLHKLSINYFIK